MYPALWRVLVNVTTLTPGRGASVTVRCAIFVVRGWAGATVAPTSDTPGRGSSLTASSSPAGYVPTTAQQYRRGTRGDDDVPDVILNVNFVPTLIPGARDLADLERRLARADQVAGVQSLAGSPGRAVVGPGRSIGGGGGGTTGSDVATGPARRAHSSG